MSTAPNLPQLCKEFSTKRVIISLALSLAMVCTALQAQNLSTSRIQRQHGPTSYQQDRLKLTEANLVITLDSTWRGEQQTAIQLVRYLGR